MVRIVQAMAGARYGGAETFFARLCIGLKRLGVEQMVVTRPDTSRAALLSNAGIPVSTARFGGRLDFRTTATMRKVLEQFKPNVVMTWMSRATQHCPRADTNVPFVHVARLGGYYDLKYYKQCDYLIGNTQGIVNWLQQQRWPKDYCQYIPNFVPREIAEPMDRKAFGTPAGVPLLLAAGRLHHNKGFDILLKSISRVSGVHLWIAGEGPLKQSLRNLATKLGISDRVCFLGWRSDMPALYSASDLFVCASRQEPFGNVVVEAWAHGVPVIAAASKGPIELIEENVNGQLFPIDDVSALANRISELLKDGSRSRALIEGGQLSYSNLFTESVVLNQYKRFLESIVK